MKIYQKANIFQWHLPFTRKWSTISIKSIANENSVFFSPLIYLVLEERKKNRFFGSVHFEQLNTFAFCLCLCNAKHVIPTDISTEHRSHKSSSFFLTSCCCCCSVWSLVYLHFLMSRIRICERSNWIMLV